MPAVPTESRQRVSAKPWLSSPARAGSTWCLRDPLSCPCRGTRLSVPTSTGSLVAAEAIRDPGISRATLTFGSAGHTACALVCGLHGAAAWTSAFRARAEPPNKETRLCGEAGDVTWALGTHAQTSPQLFGQDTQPLQAAPGT